MRYCKYCGKEIADEAVICLNCGCEVKPIKMPYANNTVNSDVPQENDNSMALWSMVCGIASFFIGWFALGITAIVLSNLSKKDTGERCPMATAGFICGIISTVVYSFLFVVIISIAVSF